MTDVRILQGRALMMVALSVCHPLLRRDLAGKIVRCRCPLLANFVRSSAGATVH